MKHLPGLGSPLEQQLLAWQKELCHSHHRFVKNRFCQINLIPFHDRVSGQRQQRKSSSVTHPDFSGISDTLSQVSFLQAHQGATVLMKVPWDTILLRKCTQRVAGNNLQPGWRDVAGGVHYGFTWAKSIKSAECEAGSALGNTEYQQTGNSTLERTGSFQLTAAVFACLLKLHWSPNMVCPPLMFSGKEAKSREGMTYIRVHSGWNRK